MFRFWICFEGNLLKDEMCGVTKRSGAEQLGGH